MTLVQKNERKLYLQIGTFLNSIPKLKEKEQNYMDLTIQ